MVNELANNWKCYIKAFFNSENVYWLPNITLIGLWHSLSLQAQLKVTLCPYPCIQLSFLLIWEPTFIALVCKTGKIMENKQIFFCLFVCFSGALMRWMSSQIWSAAEMVESKELKHKLGIERKNVKTEVRLPSLGSSEPLLRAVFLSK